MPQLNGSRTHDNLKQAFAAESQANRRYMYFARRADIEARAAVLSPPAEPLRLPERRQRDAIHVYEEATAGFSVPAHAGASLRICSWHLAISCSPPSCSTRWRRRFRSASITGS